MGRGSLGCGATCAKILLFLFNIIFLLVGALSLGVGIWVIVDNKSFMKLANMGLSQEAIAKSGAKEAAENYLNSSSLLFAVAYAMIGIGAFNFVVGFCGCCGAIKESKCLLYIYAFLVGLVLVVEIAGAVVAAIFRNKIEEELSTQLKITLDNYYMGIPNGINAESRKDYSGMISLAWDYAQVLFKCCGVAGPQDFGYMNTDGTKNSSLWYRNYRNYTWNGITYQNDQVFIPTTCCQFSSTGFLEKAAWDQAYNNMENKTCPVGDIPGLSSKPTAFNNGGCLQSIKDQVKQYALILIAAAAGIAGIELFVIIFACCMISAINEENKYN